MKRMLTILFVAVVSLAVFMISVTGVDIPVGVEEIVEIQSETLNASQLPVATHTAYAGNLTELTLYGRSQTKHWQGYYGQITGTIVLDDAQNWTLYDWPNSEPKGEIYALTNSSIAPDWLNVECFDYDVNLARWETHYNMTYNDVDGINETFNLTTHPTFSVGVNTILSTDLCPSTYTHVSDVFQTDKFVEVLLQDPSTGQLIYTTIIENDDEANNTDPTGFDGRTHDFQLLVGEDGTSLAAGVQNTNPMVYYFYIDIE